MENKRTLENIAPFLPYGLKVIYSDHVPADPDYVTQYIEKVIGYDTDKFESITEYFLKTEQGEPYLHECKPVLRKMDLTQGILVNNDIIYPYKELTKLFYNEVKDCDIKVLELRSNYLSLIINGSGFVGEIHKINIHSDTMRGCQLKWLYKHKFDVDGLIDDGLAIDADSLPTNPYNN